MPGPSERKRLDDIDKARKAVAEKIVRRCGHTPRAIFAGGSVFCRRLPTAIPSSSRNRWRLLLSKRPRRVDSLSGPLLISTISLPLWDFTLKDTAL